MQRLGMRPGYDFRTRTANMDLADQFHSLMRVVRDKIRRMEEAASTKMLKEVKHYLAELGLDMDLNKSYIEQYRSGSDSFAVSAAFTVKDLWARADLDAHTVSMSVWDVTRMDPKKVTEISPGVWQASMEWGG